MRTDGVVLHPVIYQFCANWDETKREVPPKFDEINKFCGVRFMFQSDTREELRKQPVEYVTNYDRMLDKLIAKFGKPDNFVRRGQVVIETLDGDSTDQKDRKFSIWRWCPARDRALHTIVHRERGALARPDDGRGYSAVFDAAVVGVRVCARKQRLQGRQALQDAARAQIFPAIPQRACLNVRL